MAWTEDRADEIANGYRNKKGKALAALAALTEIKSLAAHEEMQTVSNLLQFYGGSETIRGNAMAAVGGAAGGELAGNASCEAALEWLRRKAGAGNVFFPKPGAVLRWGIGDAFRAYVLGPPRTDDKLRKLNPSKGAEREVYLALGEDVETMQGLAGIHDDRDDELWRKDQPFARPYWRRYGVYGSETTARLRELDQVKDSIIELYEADVSRSRAIDDEWLGSVENLALKIDGDVNNTSLVLALELADKKVLLFPGDAQVGNWLSWGDQTYPADEVKDGPRLTIDQLLARTIFYKVGHHASHNATLRERGLELMTDPNLCAMIPVVEKTAREQKTSKSPKGWAMPYGDLYARLEQLTKGRVLRGDGVTSTEKTNFGGSIFTLDYAESLVEPDDPLWVELSLPL